MIRTRARLVLIALFPLAAPAGAQTRYHFGAGVAHSINHPRRTFYGGQVFNLGLTFPRQPIDMRLEVARFSGRSVCTRTCGKQSWTAITSLMIGSHWTEGKGAVRSELGGAAGVMTYYNPGPALRTYFATVIGLGRKVDLRVEGAYAVGLSLRNYGGRGDGWLGVDYLSLHLGLSNRS